MSSLSPNSRGIAFMCGAVVILPVMDAVSKSLTENYSPVQIAAVRFGCLLLVLAPWMLGEHVGPLRWTMVGAGFVGGC